LPINMTVQPDATGFDVWFSFPLDDPSPTPAGTRGFHWISIGGA